MQNDLASPDACGLSAREDEIDELLEVVLRQATYIRGVPVAEFFRSVRKRPEFRHFFGSRRPERVRESQQVMLKDAVDHMDMVEDAKHDRGILAGQPVEILADDIEKAAIGPSFDGNEF